MRGERDGQHFGRLHVVNEYLARGDLCCVTADAVMHSLAFFQQGVPAFQRVDIGIAGERRLGVVAILHSECSATVLPAQGVEARHQIVMQLLQRLGGAGAVELGAVGREALNVHHHAL